MSSMCASDFALHSLTSYLRAAAWGDWIIGNDNHTDALKRQTSYCKLAHGLGVLLFAVCSGPMFVPVDGL